MILRLALRSLATRPIRTAVLACGFGFGIAVMAALLGVGDVILEQAHSPALEGGGDVVVTGRFGALEHGRFLIASILASPDLAARTAKPLTTSALTPEYRREMIRVFTKRAVLAAAQNHFPGGMHVDAT